MANLPPDPDTTSAIEHAVRVERARVLASLVADLRDLELAEDMFQEALVAAIEAWPERGIPRSPGAWLLTTARRRAIDRIRRSANFEVKRAEYEIMIKLEHQMTVDEPDGDIPDERLRLIFICCHPALSEPAQTALTLKTVAGLRTGEIAQAFVTTEETMAQRLVRAKRKIKTANIPYIVPDAVSLPDRLSAVLSVIYLIFNEGYSASSGDQPIRKDLCREAIRLALLLRELLPRQAEIAGLLALMLLNDSREPARCDAAGDLVTLEHQDRSLWDRDQIARGSTLLIGAMAQGEIGPYQIQAAISAVHCESANYRSTDWEQICLLYEKLYEMMPSDVVMLNAAVALSMASNAETGLQAIKSIEESGSLDGYIPFHIARAEMLLRAGFKTQAADAFRTAIGMTCNSAEHRYLTGRLQTIA